MLFIEILTEPNIFRQDIFHLTFMYLNTVLVKKNNIYNKGNK